MTVGQLIEHLKEFDPRFPVVIPTTYKYPSPIDRVVLGRDEGSDGFSERFWHTKHALSPNAVGIFPSM